jgi:hypothetical protein
MPNTLVGSGWSSGSLIFTNKATGATILTIATTGMTYSMPLTVGVNDTGHDVKFFGATSGKYWLWDESEDKMVLLGAADITGAVQITGAVTVGVAGTGHDVTLYSDTTGASLTWTNASDKLVGVGNATAQFGESTTGVTTAGGTTMIYGYGVHKTNALTGTLRGIRGNAAVIVASAAGTAEGVFGRAANGLSTADTTGVNLGTARGGSFLVAGVGLAAGGPAVLSSAVGVYVQLDLDAANLTVDDARGLYVNVQSGNAAANTLTACNLVYLEYESVVGTAPAINSAIKVATIPGATGATCLIDASTFELAVTDTDKVSLIKFKNSAGVTKTLVYDTSDNAFTAA